MRRGWILSRHWLVNRLPLALMMALLAALVTLIVGGLGWWLLRRHEARPATG